MRSDAQLAFVPIGGNFSLVGGAGISIPLPGIIDLLGQGAGTPPANIIGNVTLFGTDVGIGGKRPELNVVIGTAFTTGTSATLNLALQGAPDLGTPTFQPGTWQTLEETGALTAAQLTANQVIMRLPFPPAFPANLRPRYLRLYAQIPAAADFTAGTIASALVTLVRDDQGNKYAANNYVVS